MFLGNRRRRACVKLCESRSVFCVGFCKPAVEIIKKKMPKATAMDFHGWRQFPQASAFFLFLVLFFFLCGNRKRQEMAVCRRGAL